MSSGNSLFESPKKEAFQAFRKQLENGAACSGEMQELSKRLNVPVATLYVWKVDFKKKLIRSGELNPSTSKMNPRDKFQAVLDTNSMTELEIGEYLRKRGILKEELEFWKKQLENALEDNPKLDKYGVATVDQVSNYTYF